MCDFCNNSGKRINTLPIDGEDDGNYELLIYGNHWLRINSTAQMDIPVLRMVDRLNASIVEINYCPMCGRNLK